MAPKNIVGYCMKCKEKREMVNGKVVQMGTKTKRDAYKGECTKCGTNMFKIVSAEDRKALGLPALVKK